MLKETPLLTGGGRWHHCAVQLSSAAGWPCSTHGLGSQRAPGPHWPLVVPGVVSAWSLLAGVYQAPAPVEPPAVQGVCRAPSSSPGFGPGPVSLGALLALQSGLFSSF